MFVSSHLLAEVEHLADEIGDRACTAGIALHDLSPQAGSLEELFLGWTSNDTHSSAAGTHVVTETERQAVPRLPCSP